MIITKITKRKSVKPLLANDIYDGKLYGSVTCTPVSVMWYNKEMFKKQGVEVPATWDDFKAVCKKFIDAGIKPIGTSVKEHLGTCYAS